MSNEINPPANFDHYRVRQMLTNRRNLTSDETKREQINLLLAQIENYEKAEGMQRIALATAIKKQMALL